MEQRIGEALKKTTNGLYIIGSKYGDSVNAMTAVWLTRLSFTPQLLGVAIGNTRFSHNMIERSGVFSVSVLGPDQIALSRHFGLQSGRDTDKFVDIPYITKVTGAPILQTALAYLDCKVVSHHETGDHTLFVGEVLDGAVWSETEPAIYKKKEIFGNG
ncbi:MAG: flavin reductase family protein [Thermodesulfobacteriota bacterium]